MANVDRLALVDETRVARDDGQQLYSREAGQDVFDEAVDKIFLLGGRRSCSGTAARAMEGFSDSADFGAAAVFAVGLGFRRLARADLQRERAHRLGDVLELRLAHVGDSKVEPRLHLPISVLGKTDAARQGDTLKPRGDIDTVAHEVAVALLDDVAHVDADAEHDASVPRARRRCARPWRLEFRSRSARRPRRCGIRQWPRRLCA